MLTWKNLRIYCIIWALILKEASADGFKPGNGGSGLNVEHWTLSLNDSGYQFDINELNVEYWILNIEFLILDLNI